MSKKMVFNWAGEPGGKKVWLAEITVANHGQYEAGPFHFGASYEDGSLDRVLSSLQAIRASIPEEYRATAACAITAAKDRDCSPEADEAVILVLYTRPATANEGAAEDAREEEDKRGGIEHARAEYERLKAIFGPRQ